MAKKQAVKKAAKPKKKSSKGKSRSKEKLPFLVNEYAPIMGRPSLYTTELAEYICNKIATSVKGLNTICKEDSKMPAPSTIYDWLADKDKADFSERYTRAREMQADLLADEVIEIADDNRYDREAFTGPTHVQRAKLKMDARKWKASKLAPKKYGDRSEVEMTVKQEQPLFGPEPNV